MYLNTVCAVNLQNARHFFKTGRSPYLHLLFVVIGSRMSVTSSTSRVWSHLREVARRRSHHEVQNPGQLSQTCNTCGAVMKSGLSSSGRCAMPQFARFYFKVARYGRSALKIPVDIFFDLRWIRNITCFWWDFWVGSEQARRRALGAKIHPRLRLHGQVPCTPDDRLPLRALFCTCWPRLEEATRWSDYDLA